MFTMLCDLLRFDDASDYEEFYEDLDFRTYSIDQSIFNKLSFANKTEQRILSHLLEDARSYALELEWKLARTGTDAFMMSEQELTDLRKENLELIRENTRLATRNEILLEQIKFVRESSNRANMKAIDNEYAIERPEHSTEKHQTKQGTRFSSVDGITKTDKQKLATCYELAGWTLEQIRDELNVKTTSTIRQYISAMSNRYELKRWQGETLVCWDKDAGGEQWNIQQFKKEPEAITA